MYISSIPAINNSSFGVMQSRNAMTNLAKGTGESSFGDFKALQEAEKRFQMDNLQNQLVYKTSTTEEEAKKKLEKENIKRSFSTFA